MRVDCLLPAFLEEVYQVVLGSLYSMVMLQILRRPSLLILNSGLCWLSGPLIFDRLDGLQ